MPLPELTGTLGIKRAAHLLHRASFGATKQQIDGFASLTAAAAVTQLFQTGLPDPKLPIDAKTNSDWLINGPTEANSSDGDLQEFFKGWLLAQMLSQNIPASQSLSYSVREKVVFFTHTVLTTIQTKVDSSRALYFQNQLYRVFAFDKAKEAKFNFKNLTKKVSVDNAMLRLLDGNLNVNGSPNENYARELHELYTIGRGLEGTAPPITDAGDYFVYREQDVQAAAKVLSGWDILNLGVGGVGKIPDASAMGYVPNPLIPMDTDTNLPRGKVRGSANNASGHDNSVKQFSDRFGNATITPDTTLTNGNNATEASALKEIDDLIELIYSKPETAKNICRRIYRFYVYHDITTGIDDTIITQMAATFQASGYKLQPVLEELFKSQHFYDGGAGVNDDSFGAIIKSPLDLMMGTFTLFNVKAQLPDYLTSPNDFYDKTNGLISELALMGMNFYEPYDVAGYDAYHQYPIFHRSWISTNYLTRRYEMIKKLTIDNLTMQGALQIDIIDFVRTNFSNAIASNARSLIVELAKYLLPVTDNLTYDTAVDDASGLTAERMNYFLSAFLGTIDINPEAAWTARWGTGYDFTNVDTVRGQLQSLFNAMMQSPEYQLY